MKIINIKKVKAEKYEIEFDNGFKEVFYEDIIIKYNLLSKVIDDNLYDEMIRDNEYYALLFLAIKQIEKKLRSEYEMIEFLNGKTNEENINKIIEKLKDLKLIDDKLFAKSFVNDKYNISKFGKLKIVGQLESLRIDPNYIEDAISIISDDVELERIEKIIDKYFKGKKASYSKIRNKVYMHLIDKGYEKELVLDALNRVVKDNSKTINPVYDKYYKKYSSKYSDNELSQKVITALINQGYSYDEIKKVEK